MKELIYHLAVAALLVTLDEPRRAAAKAEAPAAWPVNLECLADEQVCQAAGLGLTGPELLDFFRKRTPSAGELKRVAGLVEQLDSNQFAVRQQATRKLVEAGVLALPALRQATRGQALEVTQRAQQCIDQIEAASPPGLATAVARLVRVRNPDGACEVLLAFLPFGGDDALEEDVLTALLVVGARNGRVDPVLARALSGPAGPQRTAAALVVGRWGTAEQRQQVGKLLADRDPLIRLRAAQGLAAARDRSAVPTLIALLTEAPVPFALQAEDLLDRCARPPDSGADFKPPAPSLGGTEEERRKCRTSWEAWWQVNADKVKLADARLDQPLTSTNRRAREGTLRFLDAILKGDQAAIKRTTNFPFCILGIEVISNREGLDNLFKGIQSPNDNRNFVIERVLTVDEYLPHTEGKMKEFLGGLRKTEVRAVYVGVKGSDKSNDRGVVILRVADSQAQVIGIDEYKPQKK